MFEQATLTTGPAGRRALTTVLGLTSQAVLVTASVMVPMVWPQVLPTAHILETLVPPLPPAPPPAPLGGAHRKMPTHVGSMRPIFLNGHITAPIDVPKGPIPILQDEPLGVSIPGMVQGLGGSEVGVPGGILQNLVGAIPAPRVVAPPLAVVPTPAPAIVRYKEGGNVQLGKLLNRVEPQYPAIAKAAHVSGTVELECVVGPDGRIREVKVKSGNPLLVQPSVAAAWQWLYAPSKLNGVPIEIVTILKFTFKLN